MPILRFFRPGHRTHEAHGIILLREGPLFQNSAQRI